MDERRKQPRKRLSNGELKLVYLKQLWQTLLAYHNRQSRNGKAAMPSRAERWWVVWPRR